MSDDKENHEDNFFNCTAGDDERRYQLEVEFDYGEGDEPTVGLPALASIHTHLHNVSQDAVAQTLIILAHSMVAEHLAHKAFKDCPSPALAHIMGKAAASAYLKEMIDNVPKAVQVESTTVPNDISELLEGEQ